MSCAVPRRRLCKAVNMQRGRLQNQWNCMKKYFAVERKNKKIINQQRNSSQRITKNKEQRDYTEKKHRLN